MTSDMIESWLDGLQQYVEEIVICAVAKECNAITDRDVIPRPRASLCISCDVPNVCNRLGWFR